MSAILQANYRRSADPTVSVPAPSDGHGDPYFYDKLALDIHSHARAGFKLFQLPPLNMTIGGSSPTSDGYGVWWEYHYGTENNPTRFGHMTNLRRLCAMGWANGIYPLADWVPHQRYGGNNGVYRYPSWGGKDMGRFPKNPGYFRGVGPFVNGVNARGYVPNDPVADPPDDFAFGDELEPLNSVPHGQLLEKLQEAGHWMFRSFQLAGARTDDTKGQCTEVVGRWSQYGAMKDKMIIGEYAEGNKDTLAWWLSQVPQNCQTFDFEVKYRIRDMCNNGSRFDMRRLADTGLISKGPAFAMRSANFVENADSDTNGFGSVIYNKLLGYAWILTSEGLPCIYYRDYAPDKYCYNLKPRIDNLLWIHEMLAAGGTQWRHAEYQFAVFERLGGPGLIVGLNNDVWGGWKRVYVNSNFGAYQRLHDYTGHANDVTTDGNGGFWMWIPPNDNGAGYCAYSRQGLSQALPIASHPTIQFFEGAPDLIDGPAIDEGSKPVSIFCEADKPLQINKESGNGVRFRVIDSAGTVVLPEGVWKGRSGVRGYHKISAYCSGSSPVSYEMTAEYQAPQTLALEEV